MMICSNIAENAQDKVKAYKKQGVGSRIKPAGLSRLGDQHAVDHVDHRGTCDDVVLLDGRGLGAGRVGGHGHRAHVAVGLGGHDLGDGHGLAGKGGRGLGALAHEGGVDLGALDGVVGEDLAQGLGVGSDGLAGGGGQDGGKGLGWWGWGGMGWGMSGG